MGGYHQRKTYKLFLLMFLEHQCNVLEAFFDTPVVARLFCFQHFEIDNLRGSVAIDGYRIDFCCPLDQ